MSAKPGQVTALKAALERLAVRPARLPVSDVATVRRVVAGEVARLAGVPAEHVRKAMRLREDFGLRNLDLLELLLVLEERLLLTREIAIDRVATVGDLVAAASGRSPTEMAGGGKPD